MTRAKIQIVRNARSVEEWAERIRGVWQDNVAGIFEMGNLLESAREELGREQFKMLWHDELKYSKQTVSHLIKIATDEKLRQVQHAVLPASWFTLYALARLTAEQFAAGIESGAIHPGMQRKDVRALRGDNPSTARSNSKSDDDERDPVDMRSWRRDLHGRITRAAFALAASERAELFAYLRQILDSTERDLTAKERGADNAIR